MHSENPERDLELEFCVKIKTFGRPDKLTNDIGKRLAKVTALAFGKTTVVHGDQEFTWSPSDHHG